MPFLRIDSIRIIDYLLPLRHAVAITDTPLLMIMITLRFAIAAPHAVDADALMLIIFICHAYAAI